MNWNRFLMGSLFDGEPAPAGGGAPPAAPPFDATAFRTEMLGEVKNLLNTTLNGFASSMKKDFEKIVKPAAPPPEPPPPPPPGDDQIKDPAANAIIQSLRRDVNGLKGTLESTEKRATEAENKRVELERVGAIRGAMGSIPFVNDGAREDFFRTIQGDVKRSDDGAFVADSGKGVLITVEEYVRQAAEQRTWLLAKQPGGGAGAAPGSRVGGAAAPDVVNMTPEQISKLTPEQRATAWREAATALGMDK